jgi:hypothetical protein
MTTKKKERIKPPTKSALKDASKLLVRKHPAGGRVLADASVAKREGVKKRSSPKRSGGKRG